MSEKLFFIAEAGVNHNGSLETAIELVKVAKAAGANAVKFQTFNPEAMMTRRAQKTNYQKKETGNGTQWEMIQKLRLDKSAHIKLKRLCDELGIEFMSSPFDIESANFLKELGVKRIKLGSGELTNYPLIQHISTMRLPVILSTGMANIDEIKNAAKVFDDSADISFLHCNTEYPTPLADVNLMAMLQIKKEVGRPVGYSDHSMGSSACIVATALGATILEKHFTLDSTMPGPDHSCSAEPHELLTIIKMVREAEACISGTGIKIPSNSERKNISLVRKSIVASKKIVKGEVLTSQNLATKRPGTGLSPFLWNKLIGTKATRDFSEDEEIEI